MKKEKKTLIPEQLISNLLNWLAQNQSKSNESELNQSKRSEEI